MKYISLKEAAARWRITERSVRRYCERGLIDGATQIDTLWIIPDDVKKPEHMEAEPPIYQGPAKQVVAQRAKNNHYGIYEYLQVNLAYMKAVLLVALVMGAAVLWADVDTVVARYNVRAYQSGQLAQVDVDYLKTLSAGAVPYIAELAEDGNKQAQAFMERDRSQLYWNHDLRSWNWADWLAGQLWED